MKLNLFCQHYVKTDILTIILCRKSFYQLKTHEQFVVFKVFVAVLLCESYITWFSTPSCDYLDVRNALDRQELSFKHK